MYLAILILCAVALAYLSLEEDEEERYYYLPSSYVFHDSELVEEYIDEIKNENIQEELEDAYVSYEYRQIS